MNENIIRIKKDQNSIRNNNKKKMMKPDNDISFSYQGCSDCSIFQIFGRDYGVLVEGWMDRKFSESQAWESCFFTLEYAILKAFKDESLRVQLGEEVCMDRVTSVKTATKHKVSRRYEEKTIDSSDDNVMIIETNSRKKIFLKAPDLEQLQNWLLNFHKSAVLLLANQAKDNIKNSSDDPNFPESRRLLGYGHGRHEKLAKRRSTFITVALPARAVDDSTIITTNKNNKNIHKYREKPLHSTNDFAKQFPNMLEMNDSTTTSKNQKLFQKSFPAPHSNSSRSHDMYTNNSNGNGNGNGSYHQYSDEDYEPRELEYVDDSSCGIFLMDEDDENASDLLLAFENKINIDSTSSSSNRSDVTGLEARGIIVEWSAGKCSITGAREKNEDRVIVLPSITIPIPYDSKTVSRNGSPHRTGRTGHLSPLQPTYPPTPPPPATTTNNKRKEESGVPVPVSMGYFAVYDGHCGSSAAEHLAEVLHDNIISHPSFEQSIAVAISETCIRIDQEFLAHSRLHKKYSGTTALGAIVSRSGQLTVFNIGDCHAVLSRRGLPVDLSKAHKPARDDEAERIKNANGWITEEKELYFGRLHYMNLTDPLINKKAQEIKFAVISRVNGELGVSRSIGDPDYKGFTPGAQVPDTAFLCWPPNHSQIFYADPVIPDPEILIHQLEEGDDFMVIASDGLWDVLSPEDTVEYVTTSLRAGKDVDQCAEELCDLAMKLGSCDNITTIVVQFQYL